MNASSDDPYLDAVTRLLDLVTQCGFTSTPAGEGGSVWLERHGPRWHDTVFLDISGYCNAVRSRRDHLAPGEPLFAESITGTTLSVLHTVLYTWLPLNRPRLATGRDIPVMFLAVGRSQPRARKRR